MCYNFSKIPSTEYIRNILNSESDCFHYLVHHFFQNIYVIIMSADTPECAKLNHLKITIFGGTCPLTH